jgi:hypothetical protein
MRKSILIVENYEEDIIKVDQAVQHKEKKRKLIEFSASLWKALLLVTKYNLVFAQNARLTNVKLQVS